MQLSQDTLLAILAAVLIADVLVVFIALIWTQVQKRRSDAASAAPVGAVAPRPVLSAAAGGAGAGALGVSAVRPAMPPPSDAATDGLTGLLVPAAWARTLADEEARIRRYHRPATIVLIEIEGLDRLTSMLGPSSVERIVPAVADTLRRGAREADHVARLATGRFGVLMPETDEVLAINYVERVRTACDLWLESGAVSLRLAIGWASSTGEGALLDAEALATDRMYAELRRAVRNNPPPSGPDISGGGLNQEPAFGS
jgi:diguanylate cyclase (GGDEF)-like protein